MDVVAHSNLRMRGQAFVSFADPQVAKKAMKEVRGFPLYSKPMVRYFFSFVGRAILDSSFLLWLSANIVCEDTIGRCGEIIG